jgi:hypothetical protein
MNNPHKSQWLNALLIVSGMALGFFATSLLLNAIPASAKDILLDSFIFIIAGGSFASAWRRYSLGTALNYYMPVVAIGFASWWSIGMLPRLGFSITTVMGEFALVFLLSASLIGLLRFEYRAKRDKTSLTYRG